MKKIYTISSLLMLALMARSQNQVTNSGNLKLYPGTEITFYGNFINNGTLQDSSDMVTLGGSSLQTIGGSSLSTFNNITLNNAGGSALAANENLRGVLTIENGTFTTTGYNFTLLSNANGTASIAPIVGDFEGNITMQRYLGTGPTDWRFLASPVSGATMADGEDDFIVSGIPNCNYPTFPFVSIYGYDETLPGTFDYGYTVPADISDELVTGSGYWAYIGPTPVTVDVTGPPAKFYQSFPVSYTPDSGSDNDGWAMIGNPYPSSIDWTSSSWVKTNINDAIYIWNPAIQQYSSWVAGVGVNGGSNIIASSQAFWVQTNAANPVLECDENIKSSTDQSFIRETNHTYAFDFLKLSLNGNGYADETFIRFDNSATNLYDQQLDARKVFTTTFGVPSLCSIDQTNTDMSINSVPPVTASVSIPLKALVGVSGSYTITRDTLSSALPDYCIVLEDLLTGIKTDLMHTPSYTFTIADTTIHARFLLHVGSSAVTMQTVVASCNGTNDGAAIAQVNTNGPVDYIWTNANSDTLQTTLQSGASTDTLNNLPAGTYFVTILDPAGVCGSSSSTFVIDQPIAIDAAFTIATDTLVIGVNDSLVISNSTTGASAYTWNFGDGSAFETTTVPAPHQYTQAGTYTIHLSAMHNSCSDMDSLIVVVVNAPAIGLENATITKGITVFPNPSHGQFNIAVPAGLSGNTSVEIYNLLGAKIFNSGLVNSSTAVDMSMHAQGIYTYRVFSGNKVVFTGQLILE